MQRHRSAGGCSCGLHIAAQEVIRNTVAERYQQEADRLTDFGSTTMPDLSASARHGQRLDRLLVTAQLAGAALAQAIPVRA
jgi:TetR/AcrR family transcriptional repressor for divergent bdcA